MPLSHTMNHDQQHMNCSTGLALL